jgi:hypothetical protein
MVVLPAPNLATVGAPGLVMAMVVAVGRSLAAATRSSSRAHALAAATLSLQRARVPPASPSPLPASPRGRVIRQLPRGI